MTREATCVQCLIRYQWYSFEDSRRLPYTRARCRKCGAALKRIQAEYQLSADPPAFEER